MSTCNGSCATCSTCGEAQTILDVGVRKTFEKYPPDFCYPFNAVLNLTDECTHRCKMCFVNFNPRRMPFEVAEAAVKFVINNYKESQKFGENNNEPSIVFFGGEPLLEYSSIIVPLVEKYGEQVHWSITTNGLLLDEDKVDFFRKHKVNILLSFDGDKYTQDLQRPLKNGAGSFDENVKTLSYFLLRYPYAEMRATVTKDSISHLYENFLFAEKMGFASCDFVMDSRPEIEYTEEEIKELERQIDRISAHIISRLILGNEPVIQFNNLIKAFTDIETLQREPHFNNGVWRCGMGTTSVGVAVDGKIYPCQEQSSTLSTDIGDVFKGIDKTKHWEHLQTYMEAIDFIGLRTEPNLYNLFLLNQICPNRFMQGQDIGQGPEAMATALYRAAARLRANHNNSPNAQVFNYFYRGGREG